MTKQSLESQLRKQGALLTAEVDEQFSQKLHSRLAQTAVDEQQSKDLRLNWWQPLLGATAIIALAAGLMQLRGPDQPDAVTASMEPTLSLATTKAPSLIDLQVADQEQLLNTEWAKIRRDVQRVASVLDRVKATSNQRQSG